MVRHRIEEVTLAWIDIGNKYWDVLYASIHPDGTEQRWVSRAVQAQDEIDAYNIVAKRLAKQEQD